MTHSLDEYDPEVGQSVDDVACIVCYHEALLWYRAENIIRCRECGMEYKVPTTWADTAAGPRDGRGGA
jgi:hypothetical protein